MSTTPLAQIDFAFERDPIDEILLPFKSALIICIIVFLSGSALKCMEQRSVSTIASTTELVLFDELKEASEVLLPLLLGVGSECEYVGRFH